MNFSGIIGLSRKSEFLISLNNDPNTNIAKSYVMYSDFVNTSYIIYGMYPNFTQYCYWQYAYYSYVYSYPYGAIEARTDLDEIVVRG